MGEAVKPQPPASLQGMAVRYEFLMRKFKAENPSMAVRVDLVSTQLRTWEFRIGVAIGAELSVINVPHKHKGHRWVRGRVTIERNGVVDPEFDGTFEEALEAFLKKPGAKSTQTPSEGVGDTAGARSNATETRRASVIRV